MIDKNLPAVLRLAGRIGILEKGRPVWSGIGFTPIVRNKYLHL